MGSLKLERRDRTTPRREKVRQRRVPAAVPAPQPIPVTDEPAVDYESALYALERKTERALSEMRHVQETLEDIRGTAPTTTKSQAIVADMIARVERACGLLIPEEDS